VIARDRQRVKAGTAMDSRTIAEDWNEFAAVAELPEVFVTFYWMTDA
jgi:hypothetical protein